MGGLKLSHSADPTSGHAGARPCATLPSFPDLHLHALTAQIFGPESSGKTTLALHAIAEVQKAGRTAVFIDAEHALDKKYAQVGAPQGRCWSCDWVGEGGCLSTAPPTPSTLIPPQTPQTPQQ
eukprot:364836-Chlamydomonas_euryale.AAC.8